MSSIIYAHVDRWLGREIESGGLAKDLVRPEQFYWSKLFSSIGLELSNLLLVVAPSIILGVLFFGFKFYSYLFTILSVISFVLAFLLNYSFSLLYGLIAFKVIKYGQLSWLKNMIVNFFSGGMLSLSLFPMLFQRVMEYLPFQHMLYTPIRIFIGSYDLVKSLLFILIQALWIIILFALMKYSWHKAVKGFSGVGV
jgi:ABC-2 type transport system permease protein